MARIAGLKGIIRPLKNSQSAAILESRRVQLSSESRYAGFTEVFEKKLEPGYLPIGVFELT
jgi:hypothetical protein